MTVSDIVSASPALSRAAQETTRATLVLKKQQDVNEAQAAALLDMMKKSMGEGVGQRIDVYA